MRKLMILALVLTVCPKELAIADKPESFEILFSGNGDINSYIYFKQDGAYFIDTELKANIEILRYRRFYFLIDLNEEVYMGRKYRSNMVFDPNRGSWSFGVSGQMELKKYFIDMQMHHDCFHDIGRWMAIDYSIYWNSPRIGFGTIGYLAKNKYHRFNHQEPGIRFTKKIEYYLQAGFYAPRGGSWQKNHDYDFTMQTNFHLPLVRYKNVGFEIESNNFWVVNTVHELKRKHGLNFDFVIFGKKGVAIVYLGWWPDDTQSIRNRDGRTAFGIHLGF